MSFRGRYPSKFRRTGNFRGSERFSFKERGRPFKRKYHEVRESPHLESFRGHVPNRGRGRQVERERDFYSDRGKSRPFKKHFSARGMRPFRSRGRFIRGRQEYMRGGRGRGIDSQREFDRERLYKRYRSPSDDLPEDHIFVGDERDFDRRAVATDEWFEDDEGDEYYDNDEDHFSVHHGLRSPLTIHRRFGSEEFVHSPEGSRSPLRRSPSFERREFSNEHEPFFRRSRSPLDPPQSAERRRDSVDRERYSVERKFRSSDSFEKFVEHEISVSPEEGRERRKRSVDYGRRSYNRSLSPPRTYRSRERSFQGSERERSVESSRRSLERQIAFEKQQLQMLEHEKRCHEKRSESSIERFLDDCKRSFENKTRSSPLSRSNSFDRRDYLHRRREKSFERSLSPLDQNRKFRGLENITIERGRSIERSNSPDNRTKNYQQREEYFSERQRSPRWSESFRNIHGKCSDSSRRSRSPAYQRKKRVLPQDLSPKVSYIRESSSSPNRTIKERQHYLKDSERPFLESRKRPFLEDREGPFLEDQERPFLGEREQCFTGEKRGRFLDKRMYDSEDKSFSYRPNTFDTREKYFDRSPPSMAHSRNSNDRSNFLGVRDGSFLKERSIVNSPKKLKEKLELSPVSQPGSFERKEFSDPREECTDNKMELSPDRGLSPISQTENLGKEECIKNSKSNAVESERPNSTDSMQKFLAELEDDDKSISSNEKCNQENFQNCKDSFDILVGELNKQHDSVGSFIKLDSLLNKNPDHLNEKNQHDVLFNAYDKSFLNQTCDAYNENIFQGRYEQARKVQGKRELSKEKTEVHLSQEINTSNLPLIFNTSSVLNNQNIHPSTPMLQQTSAESSHYNHEYTGITSYAKPVNQFPMNQNSQFSGRNIRPDIMPFSPKQSILPGYPFQQMPCSLPVPQSASFQQNAVLPNQNAQVVSPSRDIFERNLRNPIFSQKIDKLPIQQTANWPSQRPQYQVGPEESMKGFSPNKKNQHDDLNQSALTNQSFRYKGFSSNQTYDQTRSQPFCTNNQNAYQMSHLSNQDKPFQNFQSPDQNLPSAKQIQSWPAKSETKLLGGKFKKKPPRHPVQHNVKEVIVISDDEGHSKNDTERENNELVFKANGIVIPKAEVVEKYKNCPPTYDVLGKMLKGFVIYFGVKEYSELQKDPIEVLQESFYSSEGFEKLDIEEKSEFKPSSESKQVCELRWKGVLLLRGEGDSREEARQVAGIALINALAKTCYTIQTKYGYYNGGRYPKFMLKRPEKPGYYKIVKRDEIIKSVTETVKKLRAQGVAKGVDATHVNAVITYMDEFFKDQETHCELIFGPSSGMEYTLGELKTISRHAYDQGLQYRWFHGTKKVKVEGKMLGVSRYFSPQALYRYLLAKSGDTVRYRLFPPQGPQIDLLTPSNFYSPNMIKSILAITCPDQSLNFDYSKNNESFNEDLNSSQGFIHSDFNQGPSLHPVQESSENPSESFQGSWRPYNMEPSFGAPQEFSNPYENEARFKRNVPYYGGAGVQDGNWT